MTEHLPECQRFFTDMPAPDDCPACGMFRVCEKRVLRDTAFMVNGPEDVAKRLSENLSKVATGAYQRGRSDALDAAREAVARLDIGRDVRFSVDVRDDALAAIDALRESK